MLTSKRFQVVFATLISFVAGSSLQALNSPPVAANDFYETATGDNLSVDAPGVLENDTDPDMDPLTVGSVISDPISGAVLNMFDDGSFEYEPPDGFVGTDSFVYVAFDGEDFSNPATVEVNVTGTPQFAAFVDEAAFLDALDALGLTATVESFEDDDVWGGVRSTISGGNFTAPSVTSMGIEWTANNPTSEVTTSNGPPRTGQWGFYSLPHGNYLTGVDCHIPGNCTDGFIGTSSPTLYAVGGWITGFFGSKIEIILDGGRVVDFGDDAGVGNQHEFFGVVDPAGFNSFEIHELEGTIDDAKYIWADDFTFGTPAGITLSVLRGPGAFDVTLQWLGGQPDFSVYGWWDPADVTAPTHELGQTAGRMWIDTPPPVDVFFYRLTSP